MTGMFRDREAAERAYGSVTARGYGKDDVSLLMSEDTRARCFPRDAVEKTELGTKAAEGAGVGGVTGGALGAGRRNHRRLGGLRHSRGAGPPLRRRHQERGHCGRRDTTHGRGC